MVRGGIEEVERSERLCVDASVQRESLHSYAFLCSQLDGGIRLKTEVNQGLLLQLPAEFPSVLAPLSSGDMEIRTAAMSCIAC
nr:hypothetical protein [Tanacetum cinerariifolium]GEY03071.1 hypothetical protein [Tanacetum cinerariifolium]